MLSDFPDYHIQYTLCSDLNYSTDKDIVMLALPVIVIPDLLAEPLGSLVFLSAALSSLVLFSYGCLTSLDQLWPDLLCCSSELRLVVFYSLTQSCFFFFPADRLSQLINYEASSKLFLLNLLRSFFFALRFFCTSSLS
ncbi:hypothetical protein F511_36749 [Dorcoceras hygrometricum]|uniref:Uncharacterized protein n=1 Tax=Dorcoceras hygrometricum TaxID=472368 RepID=A0A2Z7CBM0_9LAMI|nr:hypothetical protein F511_36749 [Dorcoceras hygrometricum]